MTADELAALKPGDRVYQCDMTGLTTITVCPAEEADEISGNDLYIWARNDRGSLHPLPIRQSQVGESRYYHTPGAAFAAAWAEHMARGERLREAARRAGVEGFGTTAAFPAGTRVVKAGGDYTFAGTVVAAFAKRSGVVRYVVEDDRGLLMILNDKQITGVPDA